MHFLPDVYVPCEVCKGKRYNAQTLEIKYKGKVDLRRARDARRRGVNEFFAAIPRVHNRALKTIAEVGLGYIKMGQPATTLIRRRSATRQAGDGILEARDRPYVLRARRTDDGSAFRRHP